MSLISATFAVGSSLRRGSQLTLGKTCFLTQVLPLSTLQLLPGTKMILEIIIIIIIITNTDLNKGLTRIYQLPAVYTVPTELSAIGIIPNKLHRSLELLSSPWSDILMHSAVILST